MSSASSSTLGDRTPTICYECVVEGGMLSRDTSYIPALLESCAVAVQNVNRGANVRPHIDLISGWAQTQGPNHHTAVPGPVISALTELDKMVKELPDATDPYHKFMAATFLETSKLMCWNANLEGQLRLARDLGARAERTNMATWKLAAMWSLAGFVASDMEGTGVTLITCLGADQVMSRILGQSSVLDVTCEAFQEWLKKHSSGEITIKPVEPMSIESVRCDLHKTECGQLSELTVCHGHIAWDGGTEGEID